MPELSAAEWNVFLGAHPDAHLLQTSAWGELKSSFGWSPVRVALPGMNVGAQILFRRLPLGFSFAYLPKGPVTGGPDIQQGSDRTGDTWKSLLPEIDAACRSRRAVFLKVEPDEWENNASSANVPPGFSESSHSIQPRRTLIVDIQGDEERVLSRMKQKTRYNIKLALKKGVVIHPSADIESFYKLALITGGRDSFGVHNLAYYQRAYELFNPRGACELLMASYEGQHLAGIMVFARGRRAWYLYGASASSHRDRMPTYLVQWEAMRWARNRGCTDYDLWGIPDEEEETLENEFSNRSDGLWGVYRFKRGFGGRHCRSASPLDRVYIRPLYALYRAWMERGGEL